MRRTTLRVFRAALHALFAMRGDLRGGQVLLVENSPQHERGMRMAAPAWRTRCALVTVFSVMSLAGIDQYIVATVLPQIAGSFGELRHLPWLVTAFVTASAVTAPLYGRLSDLYGRRAMLASAVVIFLIGSILCGLASSLPQLAVFRAVQGLGAGGLIPLGQASLADVLTGRARARWQGVFSSVFAICSVAGPVLGAAITRQWGWRWIFLVNVPFGVLSVVAILALLPREMPATRKPLRLAGVAWLMGALVGVQGLLSAQPSWLRHHPILAGCAASSTVCCISLLVRDERRADSPLFPAGHTRFYLAGLILTFAYISISACAVFLPLEFQTLFKYSPLWAGLVVSPMMMGVVAGSVIGGQIIAYTGKFRQIVLAGLASMTLGYVIMAGCTFLEREPEAIEAGVVLVGVGIGCLVPNLTSLVQETVERASLGTATSGLVLARSLGSSLGAALAGLIFMTFASGLSEALPDQGFERWHDQLGPGHKSLQTVSRSPSMAFGTIQLLSAIASALALLAATRITDPSSKEEWE